MICEILRMLWYYVIALAGLAVFFLITGLYVAAMMEGIYFFGRIFKYLPSNKQR